MREIFAHFRSKTDVAVASCVCALEGVFCRVRRKKRAIGTPRYIWTEKPDVVHARWKISVGNDGKEYCKFGVDDEEHVALKSKIEVYAFIRENVRRKRRRDRLGFLRHDERRR